MKRVMIAIMGLCVMGTANAVLSITNGTFEINAPPVNGDSADVEGWYDYDGGGFWENAWCINRVVPNGTANLALSAWAANDSVDGAGQNGYVYQSIGTAGGASSLMLAFECGSFLDADGPKDLGITFSILESDGSFVPAANTDILSSIGSGVTLIDQISKMQIDVAIGQTINEVWTFNLSSAGSGELFLRINNYDSPNQDEAWMFVDNIQIVPEPTTLGLLGIGALALRRRK
ncbi:MAG: PEP-CTERM sorting domain-containing protein [Phycisphaerae bacterium]|nr:PEP-CTERM sorting domain-containing protein [Phycisphaerae bacterium]